MFHFTDSVLEKMMSSQTLIWRNCPASDSFLKTFENLLTQYQTAWIHYETPDNGKQRIRQVAGTNIPPVAFSALIGQRDRFHLCVHQNLVFEVENVDTSHAYSTSHGVFVVPVSGVYFISASVLAEDGREVWCEVVVNGAVKGRVYARGSDNENDQGSLSILLHLKQGDDVAVQNEATDGAVYGELYTSFSGFLLFEEELAGVVG